MINIKVDEAYAFDYLSILEVKKNNSEKDLTNFTNSCNIITVQIGKTLFDEIVKSEFYKNLYLMNKKIYDLIDLIRRNELKLDARVIDDANTERYNLKKALQKKFFNNDLFEIKN